MRLLTILAALFLLSGCFADLPEPERPLPPSAGGRMCVHQCVEAQEFCRQSCDFTQRQCVNAVQRQALEDYNRYTVQQFSQHQQVDLYPSDFEKKGACTDNRSGCNDACDQKYSACYDDCGGRAEVTNSCWFCFF